MGDAPEVVREVNVNDVRVAKTDPSACADNQDSCQSMQALEVLVHVAQHGESESARVSAACALLDRGHGRPTQAVNIGADSSMAALMVRIDGRTRGIEQVDHGTGQEDRR